jgi:hypothetical protein
MMHAIVCGEQEKLGGNIFENVSPNTSPAATSIGVPLAQENLRNIDQAQHTASQADLRIAASQVGLHAENPAATTANQLKLDPETSIGVPLMQENLLNIDQAQRMGNPAGLHIAAAPAAPHAENPAATTANGHKLDPETSIVAEAVHRNTQDPVDGTANLRTLDPVVSIVADQAVLRDTQGLVDSTANLRTLGPEEITVADQAVLHGTQGRVDSKGNRNTQDPVDGTANLRTLDPVVSIVAEAVLRNMRDRIAKGVASTAQNADSLRK